MDSSPLTCGAVAGYTCGMVKTRVSLAPSPWDFGPDTAASRGVVLLPDGSKTDRRKIDDVEEVDPKTKRKRSAGYSRAQQRSIVEVYRDAGHLEPEQAAAGLVLLKRYEGTLRTGASLRIDRVDTSGAPDAESLGRLEAIERWHSARSLVPSEFRREVFHVCEEDRVITALPGYRRGVSMKRLADGLDALARGLGLT